MRHYLKLILVAVVLFWSAAAIADGIYHWRKVGGNPYRGANATVDRALELSGYPTTVKDIFREEVSQGMAKPGSIKGGDMFEFVTFGNGQAKHNVLADWSPTLTPYVADVYPPVNFEGKVYTFLKVHRCGNYVGAIGTIVAVAPPETFVRGDFIKTKCEAGTSCDICD